MKYYRVMDILTDSYLSPAQLAHKFADLGEYPCFTLPRWRKVVLAGDTIVGYWDWVSEQLHLAANWAKGKRHGT